MDKGLNRRLFLLASTATVATMGLKSSKATASDFERLKIMKLESILAQFKDVLNISDRKGVKIITINSQNLKSAKEIARAQMAIQLISSYCEKINIKYGIDIQSADLDFVTSLLSAKLIRKAEKDYVEKYDQYALDLTFVAASVLAGYFANFIVWIRSKNILYERLKVLNAKLKEINDRHLTPEQEKQLENISKERKNLEQSYYHDEIDDPRRLLKVGALSAALGFGLAKFIRYTTAPSVIMEIK